MNQDEEGGSENNIGGDKSNRQPEEAVRSS